MRTIFKQQKPFFNSYVKYPVSYNNVTNEIVTISEVKNENKLNLVCPNCKQNLIAVVNHQTPHFRHKSILNCSLSLETYIHWLTKEVFKQIKEIEIPELLIDDLPEKHRQNFQYRFNKIMDANIPDSLRSEFKKGLKENLTESEKLLIDKIEIEKEFKTNLGNIRVDIVANVKNENIFIEPFVTNQIDEEKKKKLSRINIPTLSLDLLKFIECYGDNYSIQTLKKYLFSKKSKKWFYLSDEQYNNHNQNYENYILEEIEKNKHLIISHQYKLNKISTLEKECQKEYEKIGLIEEKIYELKNEIINLKKELGIYY